MKPFLATQFNIDPIEWSNRTGLECKDKTLAQQQFRDECDINILFGRYLETGEFPQVIDKGLAYQDFEGIFDYMSAMNAVRRAQEAFATLPARIKNRFDNDPQKIIHFMNQPENRDEAIFLGLITKPKAGSADRPTMAPGPANTAEPNAPSPDRESNTGGPGHAAQQQN